MSSAQDTIRDLARRCASAGLNLRSAKAYFDALYLGDAQAIANGSVTSAAQRAGIRLETFSRIRNRTVATLSRKDHRT